MTPYRNFSQNTVWPNRLRKGSLYVAVAALLSVHTSCGNSSNDWETVTTYRPSKGVITTIEETSAGQFSIIDEKVVPDTSQSRVIIRRLEGKEDTLTLAQARGLVQPADTVYQTVTQNRHHGGGLGTVLWWGAMGYMMGRSFNSPSPGFIYNNQRRDNQYDRSSGGYSGGAYRSSASEELRSTAVSRTETRPVKGRSGFFSRGSRSSTGS